MFQAINKSKVCMTLASAAILLSGPVQPVQAKDLTFGIYLPPTSVMGRTTQFFTNKVTQETKGALKFKVYYSGSVVSAKTTLSSVTNGLVDFTQVTVSYIPTDIPYNALLQDMTMQTSNVYVAAGAYLDTLFNDCKGCFAELAKSNAYPISVYSTTSYVSMCSGLDETSQSPLSGKRIRTPGAEISGWIKHLNAIPITIPNSEAYQAMQRHSLDCIMGPIGWAKSLSLHEVADTIYMLPTGASSGLQPIINKDVWGHLTDNERSIIYYAGLAATAHSTEIYVAEDNEILNHLDKYRMHILKPNEQVESQLKAFVDSNDVKRAVELAKSRGVTDAGGLAMEYINNIKKWTVLIGNNKPTEAEFFGILKKELPYKNH